MSFWQNSGGAGGKIWKFFRINQVGFEAIEPKTLMEIVKGSELREGKLFS